MMLKNITNLFRIVFPELIELFIKIEFKISIINNNLQKYKWFEQKKRGSKVINSNLFSKGISKFFNGTYHI